MGRITSEHKLMNYRVYKKAVKDFNKEGYLVKDAVVKAAEKFGISVATIRRALTALGPKKSNTPKP